MEPPFRHRGGRYSSTAVAPRPDPSVADNLKNVRVDPPEANGPYTYTNKRRQAAHAAAVRKSQTHKRVERHASQKSQQPRGSSGRHQHNNHVPEAKANKHRPKQAIHRKQIMHPQYIHKDKVARGQQKQSNNVNINRCAKTNYDKVPIREGSRRGGKTNCVKLPSRDGSYVGIKTNYNTLPSRERSNPGRHRMSTRRKPLDPDGDNGAKFGAPPSQRARAMNLAKRTISTRARTQHNAIHKSIPSELRIRNNIQRYIHGGVFSSMPPVIIARTERYNDEQCNDDSSSSDSGSNVSDSSSASESSASMISGKSSLTSHTSAFGRQRYIDEAIQKGRKEAAAVTSTSPSSYRRKPSSVTTITAETTQASSSNIDETMIKAEGQLRRRFPHRDKLEKMLSYKALLSSRRNWDCTSPVHSFHSDEQHGAAGPSRRKANNRDFNPDHRHEKDSGKRAPQNNAGKRTLRVGSETGSWDVSTGSSSGRGNSDDDSIDEQSMGSEHSSQHRSNSSDSESDDSSCSSHSDFPIKPPIRQLSGSTPPLPLSEDELMQKQIRYLQSGSKASEDQKQHQTHHINDDISYITDQLEEIKHHQEIIHQQVEDAGVNEETVPSPVNQGCFQDDKNDYESDTSSITDRDLSRFQMNNKSSIYLAGMMDSLNLSELERLRDEEVLS